MSLKLTLKISSELGGTIEDVAHISSQTKTRFMTKILILYIVVALTVFVIAPALLRAAASLPPMSNRVVVLLSIDGLAAYYIT